MELLLRPRSARNLNFFWFTLEQHLLITFGCSKLYGFVVSLNVMIYLKVYDCIFDDTVCSNLEGIR